MSHNQEPKKDDERLSALLKKWELAVGVSNDFNTQVWRKIEAKRQSSNINEAFKPLIAWCSLLLQRRSVVFGYIAVACFIGVSVGLVKVKDASVDFNQVMAQRYITSVNPYLHADR